MIKITSEINIEDFNAWSGAIETLEKIKEFNKCEDFEYMLNEVYPDGLTDTELNDLLWFDSELILNEWLCIEEEEEEEEELEELDEE